MREHALDGFNLSPWTGDKVMHDAKRNFTDDSEVIFEQKIIVLMYAAGQRVLQRHYTEIDLAILDCFKD